MLEIIFGSGTNKVYATLGPFSDITADIRQQVDYICCVDSEGNQAWSTSTGQDLIERIMEAQHSAQLQKISNDITILSQMESKRDKKNLEEENATPKNIIEIGSAKKPIGTPALTSEDLAKLGGIHDRDATICSQRREELRLESQVRAMKIQGGSH